MSQIRMDIDDDTSQQLWQERIKSLGFVPQGENKYNRLLPYSDKLDQEAVNYLKEIKTNLGRGVLLFEHRNHWIYEIKNYINLYGCFFSKEDHILFIQIVFESIQTPELEVSTLSAQISVLLALMRNCRLISPDELTIEWRPLYKIYKKYQSGENHVFHLGESNNLEHNLSKLIEHSRLYFSLNATQEILDKIRPLLCPLSSCKMSRAALVLELFLPTRMFAKDFDKGYKLWFDEVIKLWLEANWAHSAWINLIFKLLSRLNKDTIGYIDWNPYLPMIFTSGLQGVNALSDISLSKSHITKLLNGPSFKPGSSPVINAIISMIGGPTSQVLDYIEGFFKATESLYHPSNLNIIDSSLRLVLVRITGTFVDRLQAERDTRKSWLPKILKSHQITDKDIDRFVDILMPILSTALFSRSSSTWVCSSLRNLAWLRPEKVIPPILEKLYSAFDLVVESHRLISLMQAVTSLAPTMVNGLGRYEEGKSHVIPLLFACLPSLDCNDVKKCATAFSLIVNLVNTVPIIDCSLAVDKRNDLTNLEYNICIETSKFEEFVLMFVEKVLFIVDTYTSEHRPEKIDSNLPRQGNDESCIEESMLSCFSTLLHHSSPKIFESALDKLASYLRGKLFEDKSTMRNIGNICRLYAKTNPKLTMEKLLPYYSKIIINRTESEDENGEEFIDPGLELALQIVGDIMYDGPSILNYKEEVINTIERSLRLKSKSGLQLATSLFYNVIDSLIEIYPRTDAESDSTFIHTWEEMSDFDKMLPIRLWGKTCDLNNLKVSWYQPTNEAKNFASLLVSRFLCKSLHRLDNWTEGKCTLDRDELNFELKTVLAVLVALCTTLAPFEGSEHILIDTQVPLIKERIEVNYIDFSTPEEKITRTSIGLIIRKTLNHVLSNYDDDTKAMTTLIKIYQSLLNWFKGKAFLKSSLNIYKKLKKDYSKIIPIYKRHPKYLVVRRVRYQHEARFCKKIWGHLTSFQCDLVLDLMKLATNHYSNVRSKAVAALTHFKHPFGFRLVGPEIEKALLQSELDRYEMREGCLSMLLNYQSTATLASLSDWDAVVPIWLALINCPYVEKNTTVALMMKLGNFIQRKFQPLLIKFTVSSKMQEYAHLLWKKGLPIEASQHPIDTEIRRGSEICEQNNANNLKQYFFLVRKLAEAIQTRTLHWQHEQFAFYLLKFLIRKDYDYPIEGTQVIVKDGLLSEIPLTTNVSFEAIAPILRKHRPDIKKHSIDVDFNSKNRNYDWLFFHPHVDYYKEETWKETRFMHQTYLFCSSKRIMAVDYFTDQDAIPTRTADQLSESERLILEFVMDPVKFAKVLDLVSTNTTTPRPPGLIEHKNVFKGMLRNFGVTVLPSFAYYLSKMIEDSKKPEQFGIDRNQAQRIAAPIIYGLFQGSKYWLYKDMIILRDTMQQLLQKLFIHVVTLETTVLWVETFCMSFIDQDAKRFSWLFADLINSGIFALTANKEICNGHIVGSDSTSFQQHFKLQILHFLVFSLCWRGLPFCKLIAQKLLENDHLYNPYQNIRSSIGLLLSQCCQLGLRFTEGLQPLEGAPKPEDIINFVLPKLEIYKVSSLKSQLISHKSDIVMADNSCDSSDLKSDQDTDEKKALRLLVAICYWFKHQLATSMHILEPAYLQLLPIIFEAINRTKDVEISELLRSTLNWVGNCMMNEESLDAALKTCLETIKTCNSWHTKITTMKFLENLLSFNLFTLMSSPSMGGQVSDIVISLIEDERVEVREEAKIVLSGLIHYNFIKIDSKFVQSLQAKSSLKIDKKCHNGVVVYNSENLVKKHAGILGLCSIVAAFPYDVPDFLPDVLMILVNHLNDPQPISVTIRKCLSDFKRTHHDNWRQHKQKFSDDQLAVITDLLVSPNYYA